MIKVGDRVRVIRIDPEDEATDLRTGDTGTVVSAHAGGVFNIEFDRELSVGKYDTTIYHDMRAGQLEKVEDKIMTKKNLKDGYVVEILNSEGETILCGIYHNEYDELAISGEYAWYLVERLNDSLEYERDKIMKIYGRTCNQYCHKVSTEDRELIWERIEPRKMTVAEIEEALGYPVEIVK